MAIIMIMTSCTLCMPGDQNVCCNESGTRDDDDDDGFARSSTDYVHVSLASDSHHAADSRSASASASNNCS